jgi:hypothetical protein
MPVSTRALGPRRLVSSYQSCGETPSVGRRLSNSVCLLRAPAIWTKIKKIHLLRLIMPRTWIWGQRSCRGRVYRRLMIGVSPAALRPALSGAPSAGRPSLPYLTSPLSVGPRTTSKALPDLSQSVDHQDRGHLPQHNAGQLQDVELTRDYRGHTRLHQGSGTPVHGLRGPCQGCALPKTGHELNVFSGGSPGKKASWMPASEH